MLKTKRSHVYEIPFVFFFKRFVQYYAVDLEGETTTAFHPSNKIEESALQKMGMVKRREQMHMLEEQHESCKLMIKLYKIYNYQLQKDEEHDDILENIHLPLQSIKKN